MVLFVLFEHASGYAIFRCEGVEDIGSLLPEVQEAVMDFARFGSMLTLEAFSPFKTGVNALENINCVSEGLIHEDLKTFLLNNVPRGKKAAKYVLGVADPKLGSAIQETLEIPCSCGGTVAEMLRGIRVYFHKLVSGLTAPAAAQAQLGLGHSYSRAKVKFNVHRSDNMIIQCISLLDQLDKDINTFSMRIREWYSYHFPELIKIVPDNQLYAKTVKFIGSRKDLTDDKLDGLEELVMDSTKAEAIFDAAKMSMGMDISPIDLINIERFATRVIELAQYRKQLSEYLSAKMEGVAPNLTTLIGEQVGARLISHAGSLVNLAKYPASTVQILGAEKALFRALKTKGNTPKYGLIFHSSFIGRAGAKNKGKISRYLANKCSIASRIDCFCETQTSIFGTKLREQVEERLAFFETGVQARRNADVMGEAIEELGHQMEEDIVEKTPKKKKKKRATLEQGSIDTSAVTPAEEPVDTSAKKKKKKKKRETLEQSFDVSQGEVSTTQEEEPITPVKETSVKKKKKKRETLEQNLDISQEEVSTTGTTRTQEEEPITPAKQLKKKRKRTLEPDNDDTQETDIPTSKRKKKRKSMPEE